MPCWVRGRQAHPGEMVTIVPVGQDVHRLTRQVTALGQDPARPQGLEAPGRRFQVSRAADL